MAKLNRNLNSYSRPKNNNLLITLIIINILLTATSLLVQLR